MIWGRFAGGLALTIALASCGPPNPVRTPDGTLAIVPTITSPPKVAPETLVPKRPDVVAAWIHIDEPDALLDLLGVTGTQAQHQPWSSELMPYLELVDLRQPVDGVLVALGTKKRDVEPVFRVHFRDSKALIEKVSKEFKLREEGDRVHARPKHGEEDEDAKGDDTWVCDFSGSGRAADTAVCGTPKGVDAVVDWLRPGPVPQGDDNAHVSKGTPIARFVGYGAAARKLFAKELDGASSDDSELMALLTDAKVVSLDLVRDGQKLGFSAALRLEAARSKFTQDLLETPNAEGAPEAFHRIWQDTSASAFVPGGAAAPKWMTDIIASSQSVHGLPDSYKDRINAAAKTIGDAFKRPATIGYGVRTDRAKTALTAVRSAKEKDQEKAVRALEDALEPQIVYALALDGPTAERGMRELASAWTAVSQERERQNAGSGSSYPQPKYGVRAAPAKWGLPKGSFFFDETKADWVHSLPGANGTPKPATKTEYTLHVPQNDVVWAVTCLDEKLCVDGAKKIIATSPPKRELDDLFQRKGILCGGYVSTLVGALSMHHYALSAAGGGSGLNDALAEIERDLAAPRMGLPFVITTQKAGEGGTLVFEIRGERDAFRILGEHIGITGSSVFAVLMILGSLGR